MPHSLKNKIKSLCYKGELSEKERDRLIQALEQEPKIGHWIKVTNGRGGHECDLCHEYAPSYQSGKEYLTKYCPNCGAKMEVVEKDDKI